MIVYLQNGLRRAFVLVEALFNKAFGDRLNPFYYLGSIAFFLFWVVAGSGLYLYAFFDTSVEGAYASVQALTHGQWYFGGILLGTGGLVRAYTAAASGALQSAELVSMRLVVDCKVRVSYAQFEQAQRIIAAAETRLDEPIFDDAVTLCWRMPAGQEGALRTALNELTRGGAEVEISAPQYAAF